MISFVAVLVALSVSPNSAAAPPSLLHVVQVVAALHERDWQQVGPEAVEELLSLPLERIDGGTIPADSKYKTSDCDGSLYLRYVREEYSVSFAFDRTAGNGCELRLHSIRAEIGESSSTVAAAHATLLSSLGATGRMCDEGERYRWRSDDSTVMFDLDIATERAPGHPGLALILTQRRVEPKAVDHLPFRKGTLRACKH